MAERVEYLPETPEELTAEWLSQVLGGEVTQVNQTVLGDGIGFMGDVLLLQIDSPDPNVPAKVVAKLPKKANRVMGELLGVYEREIMFFREVGGRVPLRIPKTYYSEFDRDAGSEKQGEILAQVDKLPLFLNKAISVVGNFIAAQKKRRYMLLIEYMDDFQPGDQLAGLDAADCSLVLREVAALHAHFWNSDAIDGYFWLLDVDVDARIRHGMFAQHVDVFEQSIGHTVKPHLDWLRENGVHLLHNFAAHAPKTLLHHDLRLDNVLFSGEHCAFIDWQLVRAGPAAFDVAYFITSALHEDASDADVDRLLQDYHQALNVAEYSFAQLKDDYHRGLMLVLSNLSSVDDVELGDGRGAQMMQAWFRRLAARCQSVDLNCLLQQ